MEIVRKHDSALHLLGLVSPGGVHSSEQHLFGLLEMARRYGLRKVYVHAFLDGRDVLPRSAGEYLQELEDKCAELGVGEIATEIASSASCLPDGILRNRTLNR